MLPISVIIPCFRCAATLERALASVAAQTLPPAEVILVDDASDDDTPARIAELAGRSWPFPVRALRLPANGGPGEARNAGWAAATASEWIAFLDADDEWLPDKLERQIAWMRAHPGFAWSAHGCGWEGATITPAPPRQSRYSELTCAGLLWRNRACTSSVLVRRAVPVRFRAGWRHCEDLMLWLDWLAAGHRGLLAGDELTRRGRSHPMSGGLTGDLAAMHAGERRVLAALRAEGRVGAVAAMGWRLWIRAKFLRRLSRKD